MKKKQKKYKPASNTITKKELKTSSQNPKKNNVAVFIIPAITFIAYIPVLNAGFVNWDDPDYVTNNRMIKNIYDLENIFTRPIQGNYHPLTVLSLALNYFISGLQPWSYHLLNLILHCSIAFLYSDLQ